MSVSATWASVARTVVELAEAAPRLEEIKLVNNYFTREVAEDWVRRSLLPRLMGLDSDSELEDDEDEEDDEDVDYDQMQEEGEATAVAFASIRLSDDFDKGSRAGVARIAAEDLRLESEGPREPFLQQSLGVRRRRRGRRVRRRSVRLTVKVHPWETARSCWWFSSDGSSGWIGDGTLQSRDYPVSSVALRRIPMPSAAGGGGFGVAANGQGAGGIGGSGGVGGGGGGVAGYAGRHGRGLREPGTLRCFVEKTGKRGRASQKEKPDKARFFLMERRYPTQSDPIRLNQSSAREGYRRQDAD
ncbi:hypothetical protein DFJ73DRAFT_864539 [Zopfochytrium polystomum]|nr:hypothetical protein DFJ73DRAFT_864539 [Zopfochytrium polystomum]